jgi:hypothetical protein
MGEIFMPKHSTKKVGEEPLKKAKRVESDFVWDSANRTWVDKSLTTPDESVKVEQATEAKRVTRLKKTAKKIKEIQREKMARIYKVTRTDSTLFTTLNLFIKHNVDLQFDQPRQVAFFDLVIENVKLKENQFQPTPSRFLKMFRKEILFSHRYLWENEDGYDEDVKPTVVDPPDFKDEIMPITEYIMVLEELDKVRLASIRLPTQLMLCRY